jgi:ankyrin repeat protein
MMSGTSTPESPTPAAPALHIAAAEGDHEEIRKLHAEGEVDINGGYDSYWDATPVYMAAESGHVECIRVLHELGADIKKCTDAGASPVWCAAENGHAECISVLHELGADLNKCRNNGEPPVYIAAVNGHGGCIRILHELGADNSTGRTIDGSSPIHIAASFGQMECIRVLHKLGADVNKRKKDGVPPILCAALIDHGECIRMLHELGADINKSVAGLCHSATYVFSLVPKCEDCYILSLMTVVLM